MSENASYALIIIAQVSTHIPSLYNSTLSISIGNDPWSMWI